jgi:dUTP pyrophosphatase
MFLNVNFKKLHSDATLPVYSSQGAAALDITCVARFWDEDTQNFVYDTGLAVEIPEGYVGLLFPRSSIANTQLMLSNAVGVVDSDFRGNILFKFRDLEYGTLFDGTVYKPGDRIGQLIIIPIPQVIPAFVDELSSTERGGGGFGSTGN